MNNNELKEYSLNFIQKQISFFEIINSELYNIMFFTKNNCEKIKAIRELRENEKHILDILLKTGQINDISQKNFETEELKPKRNLLEEFKQIEKYLKSRRDDLKNKII